MKIADIIVGQRYNDIVITGPAVKENSNTYFPCECVRCGKKYVIQSKHVGKVKCCKECSNNARFKDLSGQRFGRLVAINYVRRENDRTLWRCICDCGNESITGYSNLISGVTRSCGCLGKETFESKEFRRNKRKSASMNFDMSLNQHPLYPLWSSMISRCYNKNRNSYKHYGARGIKVCDRWLPENKGFENFLKDIGERPSVEYTLDRIDVNGDYCPENCRWATIPQQSNNKTDSVLVYYMGRRVYLKEICEKLGMNYSTVAHQLLKGFDINTIISCGGADFRRKGFKGNTEKYKNFNKNITIFVPELVPGGTEVVVED